VTFQCDITTQKCLALIKKELKHFKADIVLNDGAPNVGANWQMDAYNQIELSLHAMKVATETLRRGGWFITKVFRSKDYNALMYVANQLFTKVESNKPQSSRGTSAEIFMVCQGYKAPDIIDPKLLDPKYALEEVEDDNNGSTEKITSLKKLLTNKVNRGGYADDATMNITNVVDLSEFLQSQDPHEYLSSFNKIRIDDEGRKMIKDLKPPTDLENMCEDLKCCGRRELSELLKLRYKYNVSIERARKSEKEAKKAAEGEKELTQEELEALVDKELDETIKRVEREKKRAIKKERVAAAKQDVRKKMSVIAATSINNDEEL
jgi:AdoMet-dependent rRNA methyltransferase SPB1